VETRAALDAATAALRATLPERHAVRRYQADDGTAQRLNAFLRGGPAVPADGRRLQATIDTLDGLMRRARLPVGLTLYRGVHDLRELLDGDRRLPAVVRHPTFVSTTLDRSEAVDGFTGPGDQAALLVVAAPAGTRGVWVPPLGRDDLAAEDEVLLARHTSLLLTTRARAGGILVVECEVVS
jgi:hypothetical protein